MWVTRSRVSFAVQSNVRPSTSRYRCARTRNCYARELFRRVTSNRISCPSRLQFYSQSHGSLGSQSTWKSRSRAARRATARSVTKRDRSNEPTARTTQKQLISLLIIPKQTRWKASGESGGGFAAVAATTMTTTTRGGKETGREEMAERERENSSPHSDVAPHIHWEMGNAKANGARDAAVKGDLCRFWLTHADQPACAGKCVTSLMTYGGHKSTH